MTFTDAIKRAKGVAKETQKATYVCAVNDNHFVTCDWHSPYFNTKWLYMVYPGGRAILSMSGKKIAQDMGIL